METTHAVRMSGATYSRGLDILIGAYNCLDLTPLGRQEEDLPYGLPG